MKAIALAAGLACLAPMHPPGNPTIEGPKMIYIGFGNSAGAVRATGYVCSGFGGGPVVSVHTDEKGVDIGDVVVAREESGKAAFGYEVRYGPKAPNAFELEILVSAGTARREDGIERRRVSVVRQ